MSARHSCASQIRALAFFLPLLVGGLSGSATLALPLGSATPGLRIIDGDTLELGNQKIRLNGIDAPELSQLCQTSTGATWACGREARQALQRLTANGQITCKGQHDDLYGRRLATCYINGRDINAAMVEGGHAIAFRRYSTAYVAEERVAKAKRLGVWQGSLEMPWDYRKDKRSGRTPVSQNGETDRAAALPRPATQASAGSGGKCRIKGNISAAGRIYHVPGSADYARTSINTAKGERWFCSEQDAKAAGWRAPHHG